MKTFWIWMTVAPIVFAVFGVLVIINAWAASWLWLWFMVPIFHLPALNVPQLIGIMLSVNILRNRNSIKKDDRPIDWGKLLSVFVAPFIALFIGYLLKGYV